MNNTRQDIISSLQSALEPDEDVLAMWLEGADARGTVDLFSDIDLCCSAKPGSIDAVAAKAQQVLEGLGRLNLAKHVHHGEDFLSNTFHLEDSEPYLLIDLDIYVGRGSSFTAGDEIEKPLVLFDKTGLITFSSPDMTRVKAENAARLRELEEMTAQYARIEKYLKRGEFLEALGYYHKYLLTPLIEVLRLRYTPLHPDYYIVHISRHLPPEVLHRLENCFKFATLGELADKSREAMSFFEETAAFLKNK
jgi:hypothetical protein